MVDRLIDLLRRGNAEAVAIRDHHRVSADRGFDAAEEQVVVACAAGGKGAEEDDGELHTEIIMYFAMESQCLGKLRLKGSDRHNERVENRRRACIFTAEYAGSQWMRQPRFRTTYSISVDRLMMTIRRSLSDLRTNRSIDGYDRLQILLALRDEFISAAGEATQDMVTRREPEGAA